MSLTEAIGAGEAASGVGAEAGIGAAGGGALGVGALAVAGGSEGAGFATARRFDADLAGRAADAAGASGCGAVSGGDGFFTGFFGFPLDAAAFAEAGAGCWSTGGVAAATGNVACSGAAFFVDFFLATCVSRVVRVLMLRIAASAKNHCFDRHNVVNLAPKSKVFARHRRRDET